MALPMTEAERYRLALMRGQVSPDYAQMNPYAMQNQADKDAMRFMGQGERMSPSAPMGGMESAYADGSQTAPASLLTPEAQAQYDAEQAMRERSMDYTDQQNAVDSQRSIAQAMRSGKSPEGRTVGPLDVYVGPNWGEVLGDAAMKIGGGDLERRANIKGKEMDAARSDSKLAQAMEEQRRQEAEEKYKADTLKQKADQAAATLASQGLDREQRASLSAAASAATQSGQYGRDTLSMVAVGEDGLPDYSKTRTAYNSPEGYRWGEKYGGELVDDANWEPQDNPNLTASTTGEARGTQAQKTAEYRANTFGDALKGLMVTMNEKGYDPSSGQAFIDKYANKRDELRWLSSAEGQQYNSDANTIKEAALRTSTGAAGPKSENSEYMITLIPGPWDKPSTIDFKINKLEGIHQRLVELAGIEGTTQTELDAEADALIEDVRREEENIKIAETKNNGDEWQDETHRYRKFKGELQSEKK